MVDVGLCVFHKASPPGIGCQHVRSKRHVFGSGTRQNEVYDRAQLQWKEHLPQTGNCTHSLVSSCMIYCQTQSKGDENFNNFSLTNTSFSIICSFCALIVKVKLYAVCYMVINAGCPDCVPSPHWEFRACRIGQDRYDGAHLHQASYTPASLSPVSNLRPMSGSKPGNRSRWVFLRS